jgi:dTDP-4-dehydrorhamnose reductase
MGVAGAEACGFIWKELTRFFSARGRVIALTRHSLDITNRHAVSA